MILSSSRNNPKPPVDFVILTALREELDAVLAKLSSYRRLPPTAEDIRIYHWSEVETIFADGSNGKYTVIVLSLLGMGRVEAANATNDAIKQWNPRYMLLVGIAGGIAERKVKLGDVLISDQVVDYELQKVTPEGPEMRYAVHRVDPRLLGAAQHLVAQDWLKLVTAERPDEGTPQVVAGPIASGDKVVAFEHVLERYQMAWPKLLGVEMEAGGVAGAAFQRDNPPGFFMIRGVSDLADEAKNSSEVSGWRLYASDVAAAFTIALLLSGPVPVSGIPRAGHGVSDEEQYIEQENAGETRRYLTSLMPRGPERSSETTTSVDRVVVRPTNTVVTGDGNLFKSFTKVQFTLRARHEIYFGSQVKIHILPKMSYRVLVDGQQIWSGTIGADLRFQKGMYSFTVEDVQFMLKYKLNPFGLYLGIWTVDPSRELAKLRGRHRTAFDR